MKLKGVEKLNKAIERSLIENLNLDFDLTCTMSDEFAMYLDEDKINYRLYEDNLTSETFRGFLNSIGADCKDDLDEFVYSLLHEIGHYYTFDNITPIKKWFSYGVKRIIEKIMKITPKNKWIYSRYYYLPVEKPASEWAIAVKKEKYNRIKAEIKQALFDFYEKNFS